MTSPQNLIDTKKFPIFSPDSKAGEEFFDASAATFRHTGALVLEDFILPNAIELMAQEARKIEHLSFKQIKHHNVYLRDHDPAFDHDHPRNLQLTTTNSTIAYADINESAALRVLYHCKELQVFIAHVTGNGVVYPYVDALSPLNIGVSRTGETLAWHFDTSEFATTLLLQASEAGGAFEYIAGVRSAEDMAFEKVGGVLIGERAGVVTMALKPGALSLFAGRYSVHRVSPVKGATTRMIAILTYDKKPDQKMNGYTQKKFYGRAE